MSQNERLVRYMSTGRSITAAQARSLFGVKNLRARINDLRTEGVCVYTNRSTNGTSYRIGTPTRDIIATAYSVAGSSLFGN
jgi:hypothetical protein